MKLILRGKTQVVKNHLEDDEEDVTSPEILKMLASKDAELQSLYDEDAAFSQYLHDGSEFADRIMARVKLGGWVRLIYDETQQKLFVETEYEAERVLSEEEINYLVKATVGQWSDGSGGAAMDDFSEIIDPYYVEIDEFDPADVIVTVA